LDLVNLTDRIDSRIRTLSGGMKRRLGIAQALIHQPSVVLLDEPTAGLDPAQRLDVRSALRGFPHETTTIIATHLVEDVRALADRVVVIATGRIAFDGSVGGLEAMQADDAPGDSPLERAVAAIIDGRRP
jgi:ABC-2 type transport system ATP-binding protein